MNKLLVAVLALGLSVLPAAAAPLWPFPPIGEMPTTKINGCAFVLVMEGYTCTPDKFGNPVITPIGGKVADIPPNDLEEALCRLGVGKGCFIRVTERPKIWTDDFFKQLRTDLAQLG